MAFTRALTHTPDQAAYWDGQSMFADTVRTTQPASTLGCHKVTMVWTRATPAGTREDLCTCSLAVAKIVGGGLYSPFLTSELASLETGLDTYASDAAGSQDNDYTLSEFVWHEHRASHPPTESGSEKLDTAVRRTAKTIVGSVANARQPDQVSMSITIRTTSRKHWGRIYLPGMAQGSNDGTWGRILNAAVDNRALAMRNLVNTWNSASAQLGVWSWKKGAFLPITEVKVDNVWDIQRRRRAKQASYFKAYTS